MQSTARAASATVCDVSSVNTAVLSMCRTSIGWISRTASTYRSNRLHAVCWLQFLTQTVDKSVLYDIEMIVRAPPS